MLPWAAVNAATGPGIQHSVDARTRRPPRFTRVAAAIGAVAIAVLLPLATDDPGLASVTPLFSALLLLQLAPWLFSHRPDLFAPPVIGGIRAALATGAMLASFYVRGRMDIPLVSGLDPDEMTGLAQKVLFAFVLALLAYYAGYYSRMGNRWQRMFPEVAGLEWDAGRLRIAVFGSLAVFAICYAYFQMRLGVPLWDLTRLDLGKAVWRDDPTMSWMIRGIQIGLLAPLLLLAWRLPRRRLVSSAITFAALLVVAVLAVRLGQRGVLFFGGLVGLVLVHYLWRRIPAGLFAAAMLMGVIANNVMYAWRNPGAQSQIAPASEQIDAPVQTLAAHETDRARFGAAALVMKEFPAHHDYLMGESWLALLVLPVPRWIWPEKSQYFRWRDTGIVSRLGGGPIPSSFEMTLYANFGWIGIAAGMLLFGAFHRGLYEWLLSARKNRSAVLLYAMWLVFFGPTTLGMSSALQYVVPAWLLVRWMGRPAASRRRAHPRPVQAAPRTKSPRPIHTW